MKIRIKFKKHGTMKFIGHLDVMRYFQKAIRRSGVDICYSGGFSPHQVMSFAAPLGVGITSNGEYVDIEVQGTEDSRSMVRRLNQVMSEGFEIVSYRELPDTAGNAMSIVAAADYRVAFRPGYEPEGMTQEEWFEGLVGFYGQPQVIVTKKTKRGQAELDIKPLVYELRAARWEEPGQEELSAQDPSQLEKTAGREEGRPALFMKISTGSSSNIKPDLVLDAYYAHLGQERPDFAFLVQREEVYADMASDAQKETGSHEFVSLEQLGQEIL